MGRPRRGRRRRTPRRGVWGMWLYEGQLLLEVKESKQKGSNERGQLVVGVMRRVRSGREGRRRWWERGVEEVGYQRQEHYMGMLEWDRDMGVDGRAVVFVERTLRRVPRAIRVTKQGSGKGVGRQGESRGSRGRRRLREMRMRGVFRVTDVIILFMRFEAVLRPMYMRIGVWGSRERKVRASYRLFRYTVGGSVMIRVGLMYRTSKRGTSDRRRRKYELKENERMRKKEEGSGRRRWRGRFRTCAVKIPMVPRHMWLPEAHVEATTGGSVRLAGVLLKVGTYGRIRRVMGRRPNEMEYMKPAVYGRAVRGMLYTGRTARRQGDIKRVVAYASISHMNRIRVGRRGNSEEGVMGGVRQMCSHGVVSGAIFISVGVRYDRYHTRRVGYYGGMARGIPMYGTRMRRRTRGNMGRPGTSSFVGEWRVMVGLGKSNYRRRVMGVCGIVLGGGYSLWRYNRVLYGNSKRVYRKGAEMKDRGCIEMRRRGPMCRRMRAVGRNPKELIRSVETPRRELRN